MKEDKCVLVKESEWIEYRNKAYRYDDVVNELTIVKKDRDELRAKKDANHITVTFEAFMQGPRKSSYYNIYSSSGREVIGKQIFETVQCAIKGDQITIEGKMRSILHRIKDHVGDLWKQWTLEYIDDYIQHMISRTEFEYKRKYETLLSEVERHNKRCWFNRNKIKV